MSFLPMRLIAMLLLGVIIVFPARRALAQDTPSELPAAEQVPTAEQVRGWIAELDSSQFQTREQATLNLIAVGSSAVEPVLAAIQRGDTEVMVRGVHILREIALAIEDDEDGLVREALQKVAGSTSRVAGRRAEVALQTMDEIRARRTVEFMEKRGARFTESNLYSGSQIQASVPTIEIGPEWTGSDRDLRQLKWLTEVRQVMFMGEKVGDEWIRMAVGMKHLLSLVVKRASISSGALESLKEIPDLRYVSLLYTPVDDSLVPHLVAVTNLASIRLYGTNVSKAGAERLREAFAKELTTIDFRQGGFLGIRPNRQGEACEISLVQPDTAAARAGLLAGDLVYAFGGNPVSDFESLTHWISQFKAGDEVTIDVARGVMPRVGSAVRKQDEELGVTGKQTLFGLEVVETKENSMARRLGLLPGDTILAYNNQRLYSQDKLNAVFTDNAADRPPEDLVRYVRGGKLLQLKATLGEWE